MGRKVISRSRNALLRRGDGGVYDAKGVEGPREGGGSGSTKGDDDATGRRAMELSRFMAEDDMRRNVMSRGP